MDDSCDLSEMYELETNPNRIRQMRDVVRYTSLQRTDPEGRGPDDKAIPMPSLRVKEKLYDATSETANDESLVQYARWSTPRPVLARLDVVHKACACTCPWRYFPKCRSVELHYAYCTCVKNA